MNWVDSGEENVAICEFPSWRVPFWGGEVLQKQDVIHNGNPYSWKCLQGVLHRRESTELNGLRSTARGTKVHGI